jgi:hypothetical protein
MPFAGNQPQPHREATEWSSRQCRRFRKDFAPTVPCAIATGGQSGSGISAPTVSCPFAPTNIIGLRWVAFEPTATASLDPPEALVPIVAANKDTNSTRSEDFIVASYGTVFSTKNQTTTSSISVGSSSPVPVLLTRLDTGHMRRRSSAAGSSSSVPASPFSHGPTSAFSSTTGIRS